MQRKKEKGVTLIEMMLVIGVMVSILLLGIRQYQLYRQDADIDQLQYNLDVIFKAMNNYYGEYCSPNPPSSSQPSGFCPGSYCPCTTPRSKFIICPTDPNTVQAPIVVQLQDLVTGNYLALTDLSPQSLMVQTDNNGVYSPILGYTLQYNLQQNPIPTRVFKNPTTNVSTNVGMFIIWDMQIGITLTAEASLVVDTYKMRLNAICSSDYPDKCGIKPPPPPGTQPPPPAKYLIFKRTTLAGTPTAESSYWQMNANVKQFKANYERMDDWYMAQTYPNALFYYYCNQ